MIMRWEKGRAVVDQLISEGRVDKVAASRELADLMLARATRHLQTAVEIASVDPTAAFQTAYDGARKAMAAILANQGLRATTAGGAHSVLLDVCMAQLDPPMGSTLRNFDWMRRTRNSAEYPTLDQPEIDEVDVADAIRFGTEIVDLAGQVLDSMPVY